jgi:hypothetical protein
MKTNEDKTGRHVQVRDGQRNLVVNDDIPNGVRAMLVGCTHLGFCKIGMTWAIGNDPGDWWNVADGYTFDPVGKIKNPKDLKHGVPFSTVIDGKEVMAIVSYPEGRGGGRPSLYTVAGDFLCTVSEDAVRKFIRRGAFLYKFVFGDFKFGEPKALPLRKKKARKAKTRRA